MTQVRSIVSINVPATLNTIAKKREREYFKSQYFRSASLPRQARTRFSSAPVDLTDSGPHRESTNSCDCRVCTTRADSVQPGRRGRESSSCPAIIWTKRLPGWPFAASGAIDVAIVIPLWNLVLTYASLSTDRLAYLRRTDDFSAEKIFRKIEQLLIIVSIY